MLVGVISDTHDNLTTLRKALALFRERRVAHIIHAGDWVAPFAVKPFIECGIPFTGVFGNNDGEKAGIHKLTDRIHPSPHVFELGGRRIVLTHDQNRASEELNKDADILIFGHTHQVAVEKGSPLVLNPGECCGWLSERPTVALLDLDTLEVSIEEI